VLHTPEPFDTATAQLAANRRHRRPTASPHAPQRNDDGDAIAVVAGPEAERRAAVCRSASCMSRPGWSIHCDVSFVAKVLRHPVRHKNGSKDGQALRFSRWTLRRRADGLHLTRVATRIRRKRNRSKVNSAVVTSSVCDSMTVLDGAARSHENRAPTHASQTHPFDHPTPSEQTPSLHRSARTRPNR